MAAYKQQTLKFGSDIKTYSRIWINPQTSITAKQHEDLLCFLKERLITGGNFRDPMVDKFTEIDKEIAGYIVPSKEDKQRIKDNALGKGPKMVDENIQFALMQIDEAVTYLLGVVVSTPGMYQAITIADRQAIANAFASVMNDHARQFKHYRTLAKSFLDMLKFNLGGFVPNWYEEKGPKIVGNNKADKQLPDISLQEYIRVGNELLALDPYNFIWDPAVSPVDIPRKGEFFAMVDTIRPFTLKQLEAAGLRAQLDRIAPNSTQVYTYYKIKPQLQNYYTVNGGQRTDWDAFWQGQYGTNETFDPQSLERVTVYTWITPFNYGLSSSKTPQIWRFELINNAYITRGDQMTNVHNMLPVCIGQPNEDGLKLQSRSFAEMLLPFQRFASSQLNIHQRANRKKLYGITVYNRRVIPLLENETLEGGKIAANPTGTGDVNLNNQIIQLNDAPDTSRTMDDVTSILGLMTKMLPSTQANQVADLDRATRYQAAAYIQATNRRNQKLAKLIDDQCLDEARRMMMLNIMQFQPEVQVIDDQTGTVVKVDPSQFREVNIQFAIADGMRGLDKLLITDSLREIINMLLQSQAAQDYDIGGIINYYMQMQGDKLDFTQFKYQSPVDALPVQARNLAFQALTSMVAQMQKTDPQQAAQLQQLLGPGMNIANGGPPTGMNPQGSGSPALQGPGAALGQTAMGTTNGQGA